MTKVISFISRKGGTGKTTNAIQLATMLHSIGHQVALIETDTNFTLSTLRQMEEQEEPEKAALAFPILYGEESELNDLLKEAQTKYDVHYAIVDSAGKTTDKQIRKLATKSDLVIVPTSLSQNDLVVTYQTIEDLKGAKRKKSDMQLAVLPSMLHSQTGQQKIRRNLDELECLILENFVPRKKALAEYSTLLPDPHYLPLTNEILHILR